MRTRTLLAALALVASSSCIADRWFASITRTEGELDGQGGKIGGFSSNEWSGQLGVSGALGWWSEPARSRPEPVYQPPPPISPEPPPAIEPKECTCSAERCGQVTPAPEPEPPPKIEPPPPIEPERSPWALVTTIALTALGWESSKYGARKAKPVVVRVAHEAVERVKARRATGRRRRDPDGPPRS